MATTSRPLTGSFRRVTPFVNGRRIIRLAVVGTLVTMVPILQIAAGAVQLGESSESVEEIQDAVDDVLSRAAYTGLSENPISRILRENPVSRWFLEQWQRFVDWLSGLGGGQDTSVPTTERDPNRSSSAVLVALLAAVLVVVVVHRLADTREAAERAAAKRVGKAGVVSSLDLQDLADEAEQRGDFKEAVRLRFRAGLRRLDEQGSVELDPAMRTGAVRSALAISEFDDVATAFEVTAYSRHEASATDSSDAREGWKAVFRVLDPSRGENDPEEPA